MKISHKECLSKLTIILSIRDNHRMTNRWLNNALKQNIKFKILIADGSKEKFLIEEKFKKNLNIEIIRSEYDKDHYTFMKKISNALNNYVDTEFSLLADNDDFYIFTEINKYIIFLLNNKDYSACCGSIMKFELQEIYSGKPKFTNLSELKGFEEKKSIDRLNNILNPNNYREVYYDVMYTKILGKAVSDFISMNSNDVNYRFLEFYIAVKVLSIGKIKSFDDVFLLRQEDYQSSTSNDLSTLGSVFMPNWSLIYFNLLNYAFLSFKVKIEDFERRKLIEKNFRDLFERHIASKIINGGYYNISFIALFRSKFKKTIIFNFVKNLNISIKSYFFYYSKGSIIKKIKKTIF